MISEPSRSDYGRYSNYALAALGYALLTSGVDYHVDSGIGVVDSIGGDCSSREARSRVVEGIVRSWAGESRRDDGVGESKRQGICDVPLVGRDGLDSGSSCLDNGGTGATVPEASGLHGDCLTGGLRDVGQSEHGGCSDGVRRGSNYDRNKKNRMIQKERKQKRRVMGYDWRKRDVKTQVSVVNQGAVDGCSSGYIDDRKPDVVEVSVVDGSPVGFWNSCSGDVRQQLIDSKARMHIAENVRRAEENERRVEQLKSPEETIRRAMRMVNLADKQAKDSNNLKVCGWARTVAESYAVSIARSAPSSVESYDSFIKSTASVTSVSIEAFNDVVKLKDDAETNLQQLKIRIVELEEKEKGFSFSGKKQVSVSCAESSAAVSAKGALKLIAEKSSVPSQKRNFVLGQEHFLKVQAEKRKAEAGKLLVI